RDGAGPSGLHLPIRVRSRKVPRNLATTAKTSPPRSRSGEARGLRAAPAALERCFDLGMGWDLFDDGFRRAVHEGSPIAWAALFRVCHPWLLRRARWSLEVGEDWEA